MSRGRSYIVIGIRFYIVKRQAEYNIEMERLIMVKVFYYFLFQMEWDGLHISKKKIVKVL